MEVEVETPDQEMVAADDTPQEEGDQMEEQRGHVEPEGGHFEEGDQKDIGQQGENGHGETMEEEMVEEEMVIQVPTQESEVNYSGTNRHK